MLSGAGGGEGGHWTSSGRQSGAAFVERAGRMKEAAASVLAAAVVCFRTHPVLHRYGLAGLVRRWP